ncbi:hypothetical protein J7I90_16650 [Bacillus sp. ISL-57]|nr:hypothetical protein [Bacillus sp. ISL-57]MBT2717583.1 hypothetical protein [Bacillus sp. ISL-57]
MTMKSVGQQKLFEVPSSMKTMDEDIVYSVIERYSRKASEPTTTRRSSIITLIFTWFHSRKTQDIFIESSVGRQKGVGVVSFRHLFYFSGFDDSIKMFNIHIIMLAEESFFC